MQLATDGAAVDVQTPSARWAPSLTVRVELFSRCFLIRSSNTDAGSYAQPSSQFSCGRDVLIKQAPCETLSLLTGKSAFTWGLQVCFVVTSTHTFEYACGRILKEEAVFRVAAVLLLVIWVFALFTKHTMDGFIRALFVLTLVLGLIHLVRDGNR